MGFKEDADFARFLSMGAIGTHAVAENLRDAHGHRPIELERTAMTNKVWQTKVKRLRLPDIVCVRCGLRIESKAKSKIGIILSHSETEGREWHAGGMRDEDLFAFIQVNTTTTPATTGPPLYLTRRALAATSHDARFSDRKAASEGSEVSIIWPSHVPKVTGDLIVVDGRSGPNLVVRNDQDRTRAYWHWLKWPQRHLYVPEGGQVLADQTIAAGIVEPPISVACDGNNWDPAQALRGTDEVDRYVAVKASGFQGRYDLVRSLHAIAEDLECDWRLRLEADASLVRIGAEERVQRILDAVVTETSDEIRIEAVLTLGELDCDPAVEALHTIALDQGVPSEIRSAAVWGLAQGVRPAPGRAIDLIADEDDLVALHAASGIRTVDDELAVRLVEQIAEDPRTAEVSTAILQRHQRVGELFDVARRGGEPALLALRALGDFSPDLVTSLLGDAAVAQLRPVLEPLWRSQSDWVRTGGAEGLAALDAQQIRFGPSV